MHKSLQKKLSDFQISLRDSLLAAYQANPDINVGNLVKNLEDRRTVLTKTLSTRVQTPEDRILAITLNAFYSEVITDIYNVFGAANEINFTLDSYKRFTKEKVETFANTVRSHEGQLRELHFLTDNPGYLEAFDIDLSKNDTDDRYKATWNKKENKMGLKVKHQKGTKNATANVKYLGSPIRTVVPEYEVQSALDKDLLTAWYEILSYKDKPLGYLDLNLENLASTEIGNLLSYNDSTLTLASGAVAPSLNQGSTEFYTTSINVAKNDYISIGFFDASNHESLRVSEVKAVAPGINKVTVKSFLQFNHFPNEPIFTGRDLIQYKGSVGIVDIVYEFNQEVNNIRLVPFSTKPVKILGILEMTDTGWKSMIDDFVPFVLKNITTLKFNRSVNETYRVILEQPNGEMVTTEINSEKGAIDDTWTNIFEEEFGKRTQAINSKLENLLPEDASKKNQQEFRQYLSRKNYLDTLNFQSPESTGNVQDDMNRELNVLTSYLNGESEEDGYAEPVIENRWVYDMGLTEIEMTFVDHNRFSSYASNPEGNELTSDTYSLYAEEDIPEGTSIRHFLKLEGDYALPIPNKSHINSVGEQLSTELLDIDPITRQATLRFETAEEKIMVDVLIPTYDTGGYFTKTSFPVTVDNYRQVIIPVAGFDLHNTYQTTYVVSEQDLHVFSRIPARETTSTYNGTDDTGFVTLPTAPVVELAIVNDKTNFEKINDYSALWKVNLDSVAPTATETDGFPAGGHVIGDIYYGPAGTSAITRTPALEYLLWQKLTLISGDTQIQVDRFFNKYQNQVLKENSFYSPIIVTSEGQTALNLTNYKGGPDTGFQTGLPSHLQYTHFGNLLKFPEEHNKPIEVVYRIKESVFSYQNEMICNRKSNFWITPILKSVLVASHA
jgi:hypothetical protein